jgi:hypothetical protein
VNQTHRPLKKPTTLFSRFHPQAGLILLAFIGLALSYGLVTPPLEAGDESRHYAVVKYLVETGRLPVQNRPETAGLQHHWSHEGNQPPLYYALAAGLTGWIETGAWDEVFWYNPHTSIGDPLRQDNKNIILHRPDEGWFRPPQVLAVRLIRLLSIGLASGTVLAAYGITLILFKGNRWPAAGAMALTAFNPMFLFISASINNDNAVILFISLALWLMVKMIDRQQKGIPLPRFFPLWLGLLIGLGALSKLYAVGLLPLAGLLFIWLASQKSATATARVAITRVLAWSATLALVFLAVAGWFYLRNALLYQGDFLALEVMRETAGQRRTAASLATLRAEFEGFRIAYWALFGGVNILADPWIYTLLDYLSLIALLGLIVLIIRLMISSTFRPNQLSRPIFFLLLGWTLIMLAGFIAWNLTQPAGQGRLMYPAIAAISALVMVGLTWWLPAGRRKMVALGVGVGLFLFAALAPWLYIAPAYAKPARLTPADLPADLRPLDLIYDDAMRLIGYQLPVGQIRPAEKLPLTLYWQIIRPARLNYSVFIHLKGRQGQVIGQLDSYPGGGHWPTTLLQPGDILADPYQIPIRPQAEFDHAPSRLRIAAGIYDFAEPGRLGKTARNAAGEAVEPIIASLKLVPWQWPEPPVTADPINFFDKVTLLSAQISSDQQVLTLNWRVNQPLSLDYTVFIQAWGQATNEYAAGFDGPPVQNDYPTSLWAPAEVIVDRHPLDLSQLAPGDYNLRIGLYDPSSGERLPAFEAAGPLPDYAVTVGVIRVR